MELEPHGLGGGAGEMSYKVLYQGVERLSLGGVAGELWWWSY